ncbi:MAG TPA: CBS domain-containing protein [Polyangiaceae bacterium]|nr:CBS domain-containing protein [Polyangiaceae bacterium]
MASIRSLMTAQIVTAHPLETVADVVRRMSSRNIGSVLILDDGRLTGIFSERDLLMRVVGWGRDPERTRIGDVATPSPVAVEVNAPLRDVLQLFRSKKFRHLPVLDDGRPIGVVSTRDLLDALVDGFERFVDEMRFKREMAEGADPYDHLGGSYGL